MSQSDFNPVLFFRYVLILSLPMWKSKENKYIWLKTVEFVDSNKGAACYATLVCFFFFLFRYQPIRKENNPNIEHIERFVVMGDNGYVDYLLSSTNSWERHETLSLISSYSSTLLRGRNKIESDYVE